MFMKKHAKVCIHVLEWDHLIVKPLWPGPGDCELSRLELDEFGFIPLCSSESINLTI